MTDNELMAGHILRSSLSEDSSLILTNYLKTYQPATLEEVFRYLERDFSERQDTAFKKYRESDNNRYKHDYCDWEEQLRKIANAREFYEEMEEEYPTPEGEVAFRYSPKRAGGLFRDEENELRMRIQLVRLSRLCDELEELVERFKILFLSSQQLNYTEESFEEKIEDLKVDIRLNRKIERWFGWDTFSTIEKNEQIDHQRKQLERKIFLLEEELKEHSQGM